MVLLMCALTLPCCFSLEIWRAVHVLCCLQIGGLTPQTFLCRQGEVAEPSVLLLLPEAFLQDPSSAARGGVGSLLLFAEAFCAARVPSLCPWAAAGSAATGGNNANKV